MSPAQAAASPDPTPESTSYAVFKSDASKRFTLGPVYIPSELDADGDPDRLDAHAEYALSDELQSALWDLVRTNDRTIHIQHTDTPAGEWVEMVTWPYPVTAELHLPTDDPHQVTKRQVTFPAGTPYLGVIWEPWAHDLVRKGKLRGYSIGGKAARVQIQLSKATATGAQLLDQLNSLAKFNAAQVRVPAGSPDGGQWTSGGHLLPGTSFGTRSATLLPGLNVRRKKNGYWVAQHNGADLPATLSSSKADAIKLGEQLIRRRRGNPQRRKSQPGAIQYTPYDGGEYVDFGRPAFNPAAVRPRRRRGRPRPPGQDVVSFGPAHKALLRLLRKGDAPGHPFRGNQYIRLPSAGTPATPALKAKIDALIAAHPRKPDAIDYFIAKLGLDSDFAARYERGPWHSSTPLAKGDFPGHPFHGNQYIRIPGRGDPHAPDGPRRRRSGPTGSPGGGGVRGRNWVKASDKLTASDARRINSTIDHLRHLNPHFAEFADRIDSELAAANFINRPLERPHTFRNGVRVTVPAGKFAVMTDAGLAKRTNGTKGIEMWDALDSRLSNDYILRKDGSVRRGNAAYKPAAQAAHRRIIAQMMHQFRNVPSEGLALVMAGAPGAGKTSAIRNGLILDPEMGKVSLDRYANPSADDIKLLMADEQLVPKVRDHRGQTMKPSNVVGLSHEESSFLSKVVMDRLRKQHKNLIVDVTLAGKGSGKKKASELRNAKSWSGTKDVKGYKRVGIAFVGTSLETNLANGVRRPMAGEAAHELWPKLSRSFTIPEFKGTPQQRARKAVDYRINKIKSMTKDEVFAITGRHVSGFDVAESRHGGRYLSLSFVGGALKNRGHWPNVNKRNYAEAKSYVDWWTELWNPGGGHSTEQVKGGSGQRSKILIAG